MGTSILNLDLCLLVDLIQAIGHLLCSGQDHICFGAAVLLAGRHQAPLRQTATKFAYLLRRSVHKFP